MFIDGFNAFIPNRKVIQSHIGLRPMFLRGDSSLHKLHAKETAIEQPPIDDKIMALSKFLVNFWETMCNQDDSSKLMTLSDYNMTRNDVKGFLNHFQMCRDYAADDSFVMATRDKNGEDALLLNKVNFPLAVEPEDAEEWGQFEQSEEYLGELVDTSSFPEELNDDIVLADTKEWVRKVMGDFGVCPFTINPNKAGIPSGGGRYTVSRARSVEEAFLSFWKDVVAMLSVPEKEIATVLTIYPELSMFGDYEFFEEFCNCLGDALGASTMALEKELQLVFFHPKFVFRDGQARSGIEEGAANFARRGPWPMVNILRTPQVRAAQKGIPTGQVYIQNEERLNKVGTRVLKKMLYDRDWQGLPSYAHKAKKTREKAERILKQMRRGESVEDQEILDDDEKSDEPREAEIQRILALSDLIDANGQIINDADTINKAISEAAREPLTPSSTNIVSEGAPLAPDQKCPFDHGASNPTQRGERSVESLNPEEETPSLSELEYLIASDPSTQSMADMVRLADEVEKWLNNS